MRTMVLVYLPTTLDDFLGKCWCMLHHGAYGMVMQCNSRNLSIDKADFIVVWSEDCEGQRRRRRVDLWMSFALFAQEKAPIGSLSVASRLTIGCRFNELVITGFLINQETCHWGPPSPLETWDLLKHWPLFRWKSSIRTSHFHHFHLGNSMCRWSILCRLHGAVIYGNMDPINIPQMLAYIPAPWILWVLCRHPIFFSKFRTRKHITKALTGKSQGVQS